MRDYLRKLVPALGQRYGQSPHYKLEQVLNMVRERGLNIDWISYAFAVYCTREEFVAYHLQVGQLCDFDRMRREFPSGNSGGLEHWSSGSGSSDFSPASSEGFFSDDREDDVPNESASPTDSNRDNSSWGSDGSAFSDSGSSDSGSSDGGGGSGD